MAKIKRNVGGEDVMISDNLNTFYDLNKDVREFFVEEKEVDNTDWTVKLS